MHRHGSYPLLVSVSRCLKEPATGVRYRSNVAPKRFPNKEKVPPSLWSSSSPRVDSGDETNKKLPKDTKKPPRNTKKPTEPIAQGVDPIRLGLRLAGRHVEPEPQYKRIHSLRGDEPLFKNAILENTYTHSYVSKEKDAFFAGEEAPEEDELASVLDIPLGSLIETRRNDRETLGVVLGQTTLDKRMVFVTMKASGEIWFHRPADVAFFIPGFISKNLAERCGRRELPENDTQLHARMEALKQLRETVRELEEKYNQTWRRVTDIYSTVKSPIPTDWAETSVKEVVDMVDMNPDYKAIYAAHRQLMNDSVHFVARDPYIISQVFDVRPKFEVEEIKQVMEWKRQRDGPLAQFAQRAKPILEANTLRLKKHAKEPPTESSGRHHKWTPDDKVILSFLLHSLRPHRTMQSDPYAVGQITIMRLLYPELPKIEGHHVHQALINLGVISPWQDLAVLQKNLIPEAEFNPRSPQAREEEALVQRCLSHKPTGGPLGPEDLYPTDPLESVRHDFGDMRALVIDDPDAKELDDAVSIECVPGHPEQYWIHAHIANPTAVLPPTHAFAQQALREGSTRYLIHRSVPLFPQSLTHNPVSGWSLGSDTQNGQQSRVMTFSAKIDETGRILEHKVRAGLVKNIRIVTYDAVDQVIGYKNTLITHPFGQLPTETSSTEPPFTMAEKEDLLLLDKVAKRLRRRRFEDEAILAIPFSSQINFGDFPSGSMSPNLAFRKYSGFPELTKYSVYRSDAVELGAHGVVAEAMKVASRVASIFGRDHDLPLIRRAMDPLAFESEDLKAKAMSLRSSTSGVLHHELAPLTMAQLPAGYTLEPKSHAALGIPEGEGYSRVTSPLRRALDLVSHWQFHHALLGKSKPMFTKEWMENFKAAFATTERQHKALDRTHVLFWKYMFIQKWLAGELRGLGQDTPVPEYFVGYVTGAGRAHAIARAFYSDVAIPLLGLPGVVETKTNEVAVGQELRLKIKDIQLGVRPRITFVRV